MPLILAVEPDRLQASHIVAVLRGRPRTELVIAESAAAALQAIAARVPDLLLTSPLLSRQDETDLAEWLRGLGPAAAHVQSLTIPILATAAPETTRGMLSVLRRRRPRKTGPAGCEPSMFASQVGLYLERASRERVEEPEASELSAAELPAAAIEPEAEPAMAGPPDAAREQPWRVPEPAPAEPVTDDVWMLTPGPAVDELVAAAPPDSADTAPLILLVPIYDLPPEPVPEASVDAAVYNQSVDAAVYNQIEAAIALAALRADEESRWIVVPLDEADEGPARVPEPAQAEPVTFLIPLTSIYDLPPEPVVEAIVATPAVDVVVPAPEVLAPAPEVMAPAPEVMAAPATTRRRKVEKPKPKPVQDEWGFFDPGQCGFAALLDKLDEITAQETSGGKRDDVEVRVISY